MGRRRRLPFFDIRILKCRKNIGNCKQKYKHKQGKSGIVIAGKSYLKRNGQNLGEINELHRKTSNVDACAGGDRSFFFSIFVRYAAAPSVVMAAFRLLWTVILMTPVVVGKKTVRDELFSVKKRM